MAWPVQILERIIILRTLVGIPNHDGNRGPQGFTLKHPGEEFWRIRLLPRGSRAAAAGTAPL
jgi:hypothetical protein